MSAPLQSQIARFLAVGGVTVLIDVGSMQALLWLGQSAWLSASVAFVVTLCFNYAAQSRITFERTMSGARFARYLLLLAVNYALTLAFVLGAQALGYPPIWGKLASLPIVVVNTFLTSRYWVYRD
jgi:putative flippase GtrA